MTLPSPWPQALRVSTCEGHCHPLRGLWKLRHVWPSQATTLTSEESSWKARFTEGASPLMVFRLVSWGGGAAVSPHGQASCRQVSVTPLFLASPGQGRMLRSVGGMPELAFCLSLPCFHTALSLHSHLTGTSTLIFWQSRSSCLLLCQKYLGKWWLRNRQ